MGQFVAFLGSTGCLSWGPPAAITSGPMPGHFCQVRSARSVQQSCVRRISGRCAKIYVLMRPATTVVLAVLLLALFGAALFQFLGGNLTGGGSTKTRPVTTTIVRPATTTSSTTLAG